MWPRFAPWAKPVAAFLALAADEVLLGGHRALLARGNPSHCQTAEPRPTCPLLPLCHLARSLAALADAELTCLDCHAVPALSEPALQQAVSLCGGSLRHVDLRGCPMGPATLRMLGEHCPHVEVLRIGEPHLLRCWGS